MLPTAADLSLREAAAQCVFARLGSNLPPETDAHDDVDRVMALLDGTPVGGLLLFRAHRSTAAEALTRLQQAARIPLLVTSDLERGVGQQVEGGTLFPHAMAVGQTSDPAAAAQTLARTTAREARACGIHWTLAPVADVHIEPKNPIINIRAFGTTAPAVSRCVEAYTQAARDEGLLTTAKHFPGHGRTTADSHATLPVVDVSRDTLEAVDLAPFRMAVQAGTRGMMTAHVAYPDLDPERRPATASAPILGDLLRKQMGFEGVILSDSLQMEGIAAVDAASDPAVPTEPGRRAAHLMKAGVDVLLDPGDPAAIVDGLVAAVREGRLSTDRVHQACGRVLDAKRQVLSASDGAAFLPGDGETDLSATLGGETHRRLALDMARDALSADVQAREWRVRLPPRGDGLAVQILPSAATEGTGRRFAKRVATALPEARVRVLSPDADAEAGRLAHQEAQEARALMLAAIAEPAAWKAFGLSDLQAARLREGATRSKAVVAAVGSPSVVESGIGAGRLYTYSTVPASQQALVEWLQERP